MKRLGVIANCGKQRAPHVLRLLSEGASRLGLTLVADAPTAALLPGALAMPLNDLFASVEALIALGGDGTMLRTVRELDGRDMPVIGVNIGGLGFLTSVAEADLERALDCLARDEVVLSDAAVVECEVLRGDQTIGAYRGLNDVVVTSGASSRVISLEVSVDGDHVTTYVCDGLIVSTPSGSTGHSLSAGGPILTPDTAAFVVSLICPHTLSSRPVVVPDNSTIGVRVVRSSGDILLSVDGQVGQQLGTHDRLLVRRSARGARFIHLPEHSFFSVLRHKLHWSGGNV